MIFRTRQYLLVCLMALTVFACSDEGGNGAENKSAEHLKRAESYFQQGQYKAATIEIKNALQINAENPETKILLARIYLEQGSHKLSVEVLKSIKPESFESTLLLAENYIELGKANSALTALNDSNYKSSLLASPKANLIKIRALVKANKLKEAESEISNLEPKLDSSSDLSQLELSKSILHEKAGHEKQQLESLNKAIKLDENNINARMLLANYNYKRDNLEVAEDQLTQALFLLPNTDGMTLKRSQILRALISTLSKLGRSSEAMVYSKLIAESNPNSQALEAEFQTALEALKNNDIEGANKILEKLYSTNPNQMLGSLLGIIKYEQGNFQAASELFDESVDPETASSKTLEVFAATELRLNRPEEALRAIEINISDNTDNPDLLSLYGLALLFSGEQDKAIEVMKAALELKPDMVRISLALADTYNRSNQPQKALDQLEKAHTHTPASAMLQARLLQQYELLSLTSEKNKLIDQMAQSKSTQSLSLAGLALLKTDPARAHQIIDNAYKSAPDSMHALNAKLMESVQSQDDNDVILYSEKILEVDENNILALKSAASAKESLIDSKAALAYLTELSNKSVNCWAADYIISLHFLNGHDYKKAIPHAEAALSRSSFNDTTSNYIVKLYQLAASNELKSGNDSDSKQYIMDALQIAPNNPTSLHILVNAELASNNIAQANKISAQVEEQPKNQYISLLIKGDIKIHEQEKEEAILHYIDAWNMRPNDQLAKVIWSHIDDQTSINRPQFLVAWEQKLPNSFEAATLKGIYYQQKGQPTKAANSYEKSLEIKPEQPIALNNLAWIYFQKSDMKNAIKTSKRAYNLSSDNPAIIDTYAWIAYKDGDIKLSKKLIDKAFKLAPDNKEIEEHWKEISSK